MIRTSRLLKSFHYASKGLIKVFREEQNLRLQSFIAVLVLFLALFFRINILEWSILLFAITLVLLAELINSATERIVDILKPRINTYVKEIKDIMAAAVMICSISAAIIGIIIFWPHLYQLFF